LLSLSKLFSNYNFINVFECCVAGTFDRTQYTFKRFNINKFEVMFIFLTRIACDSNQRWTAYWLWISLTNLLAQQTANSLSNSLLNQQIVLCKLIQYVETNHNCISSSLSVWLSHAQIVSIHKIYQSISGWVGFSRAGWGFLNY
jgi:hypothetical protein